MPSPITVTEIPKIIYYLVDEPVPLLFEKTMTTTTILNPHYFIKYISMEKLQNFIEALEG